MPRQRPACPKPACRERGAPSRRHARRATKRGSRTRYRCRHCGATFTALTGTPYERLRHSRDLFDEVARMTVEGMSVASIARTIGISESTVRRWQKRAASAAAAFNDELLRKVPGEELQADEIKTFVARKDRAAWIYTGVEVSARLWLSVLVGSRSKRDTRRHFRDLRDRTHFHARQLYLATDGAPYFEEQVRKVFGPTCTYVQVEKSYAKGRIRRQSVRLVLGSPEDLEDALARSEDSKVINTSFVERLNLTIRRMVAALHRRTNAFARSKERLAESLELARCAYNFLRPHRSLRFGKETRTPAQQAGLVSRRLTFRDVFLSSCPDRGRVRSATPGVAGRLERKYGRTMVEGWEDRVDRAA